MDSKQIHKQLHDDWDSFRELWIQIFWSYWPWWQNMLAWFVNSDDCQASTNVGGDDGDNDGASGGCSCGYNDEDDDNEEWGSLGQK
jgi:hypothetical protein